MKNKNFIVVSFIVLTILIGRYYSKVFKTEREVKLRNINEEEIDK